MRRIVTCLFVVITAFTMIACSTPVSSPQTSDQTQSRSKSSKPDTDTKQEKPQKVYGENKPLPDYDNLVKSPDSYKDGSFFIEGYLDNAEYENNDSAASYMDVWVTYDYDESQGKYYELKDTDVDTVKILLFPSTAFRGGGNYPHIKVYCSLLYVDTDDIPVFLYGSGKVT